MHPNCRHEFIPVWLDLMDEKELAKEIERSRISQKEDIRSESERNVYAKWQAENRQKNTEILYFNKAKQELGFSMPYKDIASFRRSYRTKDSAFAHKKSHNLIRDYKQLQSYREELGKSSLPKTLEKFQEIKYNNNEVFKLYKKAFQTIKVAQKAIAHSKSVELAEPKFTQYIFNPENRDGYSKGKAFISRLGYDIDNWELFAKEIKNQSKNYPIKVAEEGKYGIKYQQDMIVFGTKNRPMWIKVIWMQENDKLRLITLRPTQEDE